MKENFPGGLLAGVTSAVIWISVCLMTDMATKTVGMLALIFLVGVTVITMVISTVIGGQKATGRA